MFVCKETSHINAVDITEDTFNSEFKARAPRENQLIYDKTMGIIRAKYESGRAKWALYQKARKAWDKDVDTSEYYRNRYTVIRKENQAPPEETGQNFSRAVALVPQHKNYSLVRTRKSGGKLAYSSSIDIQEGNLISLYAYAREDVPQAGRLNYSEILVNQYRDLGGAIGDIKMLMSGLVANRETVLVMSRIVGTKNGKLVTVLPDTIPFFALLGTDNVKSAVFLLLDHVQEFGAKTITHLEVESTNYIRIHFG